MSVELKLTDYFPSISDIPTDVLKEAELRIETYLKTKPEFKQVDMRPNSVFGDLLLSPLAHILAAFEMGANRMFSDTDLANVAAGTIYNCDFVKQYLNNFGQGQVYEYPSTGIIQVEWNRHNTKYIDAGTKFLFKADNGDNYIYELANVSDILTIKSPFEKVDINNPNEIPMVRVAETKFIVNLPVEGPAGVGVNADTVGTTDLGHTDLVSIKALGSFDRGTLPENIMELANKVQRTYYAASLNSRSGAISFLLQAFPELRGVSPVITGDKEMVRDKTNVLGIGEGKMDIFVKSRTQYLVGEQELKLTYNTEINRWQGTVRPVQPIVYVDSVHRHSKEAESIVRETYGFSKDELRCPGVSAAFSSHEVLGFSVEEFTSADDITPNNWVNGEENSIQTTSGFKISLIGNYEGSPFSPDYDREFNLFFVESFVGTDGTPRVRANIRDKVYEDYYGQLVFKQDGTVASRGVIENTEAWDQLLPGVTLNIEALSGSFSSSMVTLVGNNTELHCRGRGGLFKLRYRYDPNYSLVDKIVSDDSVTPVNTDIVVKNFLTCYVEEIFIEYRKKEGQNVDLEKAREEIVTYVNNLAYPHVYEEYTVAEILLFYGAHGVKRITQKGKFCRSLADIYRVETSKDVFEEMDVDNPYSDTLQPPSLSDGIGDRNVNFILDSSRIKFNGLII
jgi:hypothetical protein